MPWTNLSLSYVVRVTGPVEMPPRIYTITLQEILARSKGHKSDSIAIFEFLERAIIQDYNKTIENSPLLDMLDDPDRYKNLYRVDFGNPDAI